MSSWRWTQVALGIGLVALLLFGVSQGLERMFTTVPTFSEESAEASGAPETVGHITATLFYATPDGEALAGVRHEVPLGNGVAAQGRAILVAQLESVPEDGLSVIPAGTSLRSFYVTARQDAFVDLSSEVSTAHPGGSTTELLTVYALVNVLTVNLPSIRRVQILVDGKEVDTLAGHVDLRRPLLQNLSVVRDATTSQP